MQVPMMQNAVFGQRKALQKISAKLKKYKLNLSFNNYQKKKVQKKQKLAHFLMKNHRIIESGL